MVVRRYLFALDMDKAIDRVAISCHHCASLRQIPHTVIEQSTAASPDAVGISFAADVIKRHRQLILVLRECVTSFTTTTLLEDERHQSLRDALVRLCIELRPLDGPPAVIRTDPAPGFKALTNDDLLRHHRLTLEIGRIKNTNKNPVAEKAVQELESELLRQDPLNGPVSPLTLSAATATLNARIRSRGLSAREMLTQRDQFSNSQLPINDRELITKQNENRKDNHPHSERSKAPSGKIIHPPTLAVGDLVYLYADRNKSCARDRYMVVSIDGNWYNIKKFCGSQLRNTSYRVKRNECYKVPSSIETYSSPHHTDTTSDDEDPPTLPASLPPPQPLPIPDEISLPPGIDNTTPEPTVDPPDDDQPTSTLVDPVRDVQQGHPKYDEHLRRSSRPRKHPSYLDDYVTGL